MLGTTLCSNLLDRDVNSLETQFNNLKTNGFIVLDDVINQDFLVHLLKPLLEAPKCFSAFCTEEFASSEKRAGDTVLLHIPYLHKIYTDLVAQLGIVDFISNAAKKVNGWQTHQPYYISQYTARNPTQKLPLHRDTFWPYRDQAEFFSNAHSS